MESIMFSIGTLQNIDNFSFIDWVVLNGALHTKAFGVIPIFLKSLTLFWVGLVLSSLEPNNNGTKVQWT